MKTTEIKSDNITYKNICAHNVKFNYFRGEQYPDETFMPDESEEEHVKEMIIQGYTSGELCMMVIDHDTNSEREIRGWWSIE